MPDLKNKHTYVGVARFLTLEIPWTLQTFPAGGRLPFENSSKVHLSFTPKLGPQRIASSGF